MPSTRWRRWTDHRRLDTGSTRRRAYLATVLRALVSMPTQQVPSTGVPSPYALAELVAQRTIDWAAIDNRPALIEELLQTPYEDLFDPTNGSPLYLGQKRSKDGTISRTRPKLPADTDSAPNIDERRDAVTNLAQLVAAIGTKQLADIPVQALGAGRAGRLVVELGESSASRQRRLGRLFSAELIDAMFPKVRIGYHPAGMSWKDDGRFYNEAAEFFDPIQGAVGDCYLIAALSSVAWSRPFVITDAVRATAEDNEAFTHRITFHNNGQPQDFEVTDKILVTDGGSVPYCRSREAAEVWPGIYEKAYARMRLGEASDFPAIPNIAGGDPVGASAQLTGLSPTYMWHNSFTAAQVLSAVQTHSSNGRTTVPMTAWTFGDGPEGDVAYRDANVVAGHAYSVLGSMRRFEFRHDRIDVRPYLIPSLIPEIAPIPPIPGPGPFLQFGQAGLVAERFVGSEILDRIPIRGAAPVDYLIVRNPWGYFEATGTSTTGRAHVARDVDWWRSIPLGVDGVFAIEVNAFHRYFAGMGFAS